MWYLVLNVAKINNTGGGGLSALLPLDLLCPFDPLLTPHCSTHSESYHQSACSTNSVYYCKCSTKLIIPLCVLVCIHNSCLKLKISLVLYILDIK